MKLWIKQPIAQKLLTLFVLVTILYLFRHVINLILLTFIFTYLFHTLYSSLETRTKIPPKVILFLVFGTFLSLVGFIGYRYAPITLKQFGEIFMQISKFRLSDYEEHMNPTLYEALVELDIAHYVRELGNHVLKSVANISSFVLQVILALLLSFFFILEKEKIKLFLHNFKYSKASFLLHYSAEFGQNFLNTFGKVVQVQIMIAGANALLSYIGLWIIGFPQLLGLTIMVFALGLIPVAGVIISILPLSIIAFQIGGFVKVLHLLIVLLIVHAVENYFLNPKLYSIKMKLPIFFTFSILFIAEHMMGVWGLILGIPLFMFGLDMLKVPTASIEKK